MVEPTGRTLLITGAAGGLGLATAQLAVEQGCNVIALDLNAEGLENLRQQSPDGRVFSLVVDITDEGAVAAAIADGIERFGAIDGCFNNAGIPAPMKAIVDLGTEEFLKILNVNTLGSFHVLKHVLIHMSERGKGAVVNTGSIQGRRGTPDYAAYCASKAAVHSLTQVAALEMAGRGVRVNAIAPGLIDTPMNDVFHAAVSPTDPESTRRAIEAKIPMGRYASPREVASTALFLLSDSTPYITGEIVNVNGGLTVGF